MGPIRAATLVLSLAVAGPSCGEDPCPEGTRRRSSDGACVATRRDAGPDADASAADAGDSGEPDGSADAGCANPWSVYPDEDGDGYGDGDAPRIVCEARAGYVERPGDCDDALETVNPDAPDVCNGIDDDCSGAADDPFPCVQDLESACASECGTAGTALCGEDCTPSVCVPPPEICNYVDDDCNGLVDDDLQGLIGDPIQLTDNLSTSSIGLITWSGDRYAIVYRDGAGSADWQLYFTTLDEEGAVLLGPVPFTEDGEVAHATGLEVTGDHLTAHYFHRDPTDEYMWPVATTVDAATGIFGEAHEVPLGEGFGVSSADAEGTDVGSLYSVVQVDPIDDPRNEATTGILWALDLDARVVSETNLGLSQWVRLSRDPAADELLAIAHEGGEVVASRFDENGDLVLGPVEVTDTGGTITGSVFAYGTDSALLVASTDIREHFAILIDENLGTTQPVDLDLTGYPGFMGSSGSDYLFSISYQGTYYLTRVSAGGISGEPIEVPGMQTPRIAWSGSEYGLLYHAHEDALADDEIFFRRYGCE